MRQRLKSGSWYFQRRVCLKKQILLSTAIRLLVVQIATSQSHPQGSHTFSKTLFQNFNHETQFYTLWAIHWKLCDDVISYCVFYAFTTTIIHISYSGMSYKFWISNNLTAYQCKLTSVTRDDSAQKLHDFFPISSSILLRYLICILAKFNTFLRSQKLISWFNTVWAPYRVGFRITVYLMVKDLEQSLDLRLKKKLIATLVFTLRSNWHARISHIFHRGQQFHLICFFSLSKIKTRQSFKHCLKCFLALGWNELEYEICMVELPTFDVIVRVSQAGVQWQGLALGPLPAWSQ